MCECYIEGTVSIDGFIKGIDRLNESIEKHNLILERQNEILLELIEIKKGMS